MGVVKVKKVLLIENSSLDFYKARLPLAKYVKEKGWDVYALTPDDANSQLLRDQGLKVITYKLDRRNKGFLQIVKLVKEYNRVIKENDIDIIHSFRFQPNLLNVLCNLFNKKQVILHITGLGIAFSNQSFFYVLFRFISQIIFALMLFRADDVIVQNKEDLRDIIVLRFWRQKVNIIEGSGVNTVLYDRNLYDKVQLRYEKGIGQSDIVFICVTRLIWEKGVKEMIEAFVKLSKVESHYKLWIIGSPDNDNPRSVDENYIQQFQDNKSIYFLGRQESIPSLLALSDVFLYPSYYREGIPRSILEALSMSLPIITTYMPGCNSTVVSGLNGYLISPRSVDEIVSSIMKIVQEDRFIEMGHKSREIAVNRFSELVIFSKIEKLYRR